MFLCFRFDQEVSSLYAHVSLEMKGTIIDVFLDY